MAGNMEDKMKKSVWTDSIEIPQFDSLNGDRKTDVLIIGGGLCGLLCAYFLQRAEIDYILVEGDRIAKGITKNTTAKITFLHGLIYSKLINSVGREQAQMYLSANKAALQEYEKMCGSIDCDFERKSAYTYSMKDRQKIENEVRALHRLGINAEFTDDLKLPFKTAGAVRVDNQAQFNPLKFIAEISKELHIYEKTFIRDITPHTAIADNGKITADKIIVTTHFPFINKHGNYYLKLYQHRSYAAAFENAQEMEGMYVDEYNKGMSFRSYKNLLFIGGGGHRTGKKGGNWNEIYDFAKRYYPDSTEKYSWAAQDCMSLDKIPYIGLYSKRTPDLYVASGFNKWGITSSMAAAMILTDMVRGKKSEFAEVFSPQRSILKPQLAVNGFEAVMNLLTPTPKRCPHLGCALKWNRAEHTWDCPCHGSRFEESGKLIDNPSTGNAKIRK
ncbi:FAD-dependent oxidoreductase [Lachnospiraceae bacterium MD329]|nr:FAD-dependent oxidoreductase [Lachnospiraceae bacterium MD329]